MPAFLNTFHRDISISITTPTIASIRTIAIHPNTTAAIALADSIAASLMLPVSKAHESSKEKSIIFCYINKIDTYNVDKSLCISSIVLWKKAHYNV